MELTQHLLQALRDCVLAHHQEAEIECAFLSGSTVEGFAVQSSDFDVYVVRRSTLGDSSSEIKVAFSLGTVEIVVVPRDTFDVIEAELSRKYAFFDGLDGYQLLLSHRLSTGVPILGDVNFFALKSRISPVSLSMYASDRYCLLADQHFRSTLGNIGAGDYESAVFNCVRTMKASLDHLLASHGSTSPVTKWRTRYAQRYLGEANLGFVRFLELCSSIPAGQRSRRDYAASVGRYLQAVLDHGLAIRFFKDEGQGFHQLSVERVYGMDSLSPNRSAICKSACARVLHKEGRLYLIAGSPLFEVSLDVLKVWLAIDNSRSLLEIQAVLKACKFDVPSQRVGAIIERLKMVEVVA